MSYNFEEPFAILKRKHARDLLFIKGDVSKVFSLNDIQWDRETLFVVPFNQIREKGFECAGKVLPIIKFDINKKVDIKLEEFMEHLPNDEIQFDSDLKYNYSDEKYMELLDKIIKNEIGNGEGCNFVIPRKASTTISDMNINKALTIFKRLLNYEFGSHWTFIIYDGEQFFLGASPEGHLVVDNQKVRMHPISGTFRKNNTFSLHEFKKSFLDFLSDDKEINELFMVVDEELKMMARICDQGGIIVGPIIKEMSALIHTEYLLTGRSDKNLKDIFRESMYAATVVGGPMENACRINAIYEPEGREYYGSAAVLVGKNEDGPYLDSSILIRTLHIKNNGTITARVGGTLVRNSQSEGELEEVKSKLKAALDSILNKILSKKEHMLSYFEEDSDILEKLYDRNKNLSKFWFFRQEKCDTVIPELTRKKITIIDNEDDFCFMLGHMITSMGIETNIIRYSDFDFSSDDSDLVIVGAGTGNPNEHSNPKMKIILKTISKLSDNNRKFLCICLGHQVLCRHLGIEVNHKKELWQGVAKKIKLFDEYEIVGFYNTFTGIYKDTEKLKDINLCYDKDMQIHAIRGNNFSGFQFHPESILTQNGYGILKNELIRILK